MVRQRADCLAIGAEHKQAPRGVPVIFLAAADAARCEHNAPVRQDGRIVVLPRALGQALEGRTVGADAIKLEELLARRRHGEDDFAPVVGTDRRGDQPRLRIEQEPRLGIGLSRRQGVKLIAGDAGRGRVILERGLRTPDEELGRLGPGGVDGRPSRQEHDAARPLEIVRRLGELRLGRRTAARYAAIDRELLRIGKPTRN